MPVVKLDAYAHEFRTGPHRRRPPRDYGGGAHGEQDAASVLGDCVAISVNHTNRLCE
jgi:hypothetical protein|eukprot:COSAG02_NODE_1185_length_14007_cov_52.908398_13_plen_57_part_00